MSIRATSKGGGVGGQDHFKESHILAVSTPPPPLEQTPFADAQIDDFEKIFLSLALWVFGPNNNQMPICP